MEIRPLFGSISSQLAGSNSFEYLKHRNPSDTLLLTISDVLNYSRKVITQIKYNLPYIDDSVFRQWYLDL